MDKSWLVFGKFNEVLHLSKKLGCKARSEKKINDFQEVLAACELRDLGNESSHFIWCNNHEGEGRIFERLDRFLANPFWCDMFPFGSVYHGQMAYSDHYPIWLNTNSNLIIKKELKVFRFETIWVKDANCYNIVDEVWWSGDEHGSIANIMSLSTRCGLHLT